MTTETVGSVFTAEFRAQLDPDVLDPQTAFANTEAETAGPWTIRQRPADGRWLVVTEGRPPAAAVDDANLALLIAAVLPAVGREFYRIEAHQEPAGCPLVTVERHELGHLHDDFEEQLGPYLHVLEFLRRSPLDLARFLYAIRGPGLRRAAEIVWLWLETPPR